MKPHQKNHLIKIGKRVNAHRTRMKLTQNALGEKCDCDAVTIRRIEKGRQSAKIHILFEMAIVFGIPVGELVR